MADYLPSVDFDRIREYETSKQRAFEELGYVLVPTIEGLPAGTRLERRGTPDGGIEFSCPAPDGHGIWAWQGKYLDKFPDALGQMDKSVRTALASTPDLTRYAFFLPTERSGGKPTRNGKPYGTSGMDKWDTYVKKWKALALDLGRDVEFVYIGQSDLLAALTQQKHVGELRYWFDTVTVTDEFCLAQVEREVHNLGDRYVPEVNIELEIASRLDALALTPAFRDDVRDALDHLLRQLNGLVSRTSGETAVAHAFDEVNRDATALLREGSAADHLLTSPDKAAYLQIQTLAITAQRTVERAEKSLREAQRQHREQESSLSGGRGDSRKRDHERDVLYAASDGLYDVAGTLQALENLTALALSPPVLLISGSAGCGKSHLVADVATQRTRSGLTTLLLLGHQFGTGSVWPQIGAQTGLHLTADDLLATLSAAARLRGEGRALIIIDALNEGGGVQVWKGQLKGLLKAAERYPWVGVVLTVRDTYREAVLPVSSAADVPTITHPGLVGHEEQALEVYARHHGLRLPDFPPLQPELSNPLFLRALCQSIRGRGLPAVPRQAASLSWVFDGLLDDVNQRLAAPDRLDYPTSDRLVHRAIERLAHHMLGLSAESVPLQVARALFEELHPSSGYSKSLLGGLISEGLLLQDTVTSAAGEPGAEYVRFTYQRHSDYLRANQLLVGCVDHAAVTQELICLIDAPDWQFNLGLIETLTVLIPEQRGVELIDLLGPQTAKNQDAWWNHRLAEHLLDSVAWRSTASISPRTLDLAENLAASRPEHRHRWLRVTLSLACVPGHPVNSRWRDAHLRLLSLPDRDAGWTVDALGLWEQDGNAVARLINWAWSGRIEEAAPDVVKLAAQTLVWLLTSPNRLLRDSATKALIRLTDRHSEVLAELVKEFALVNDPYVVERVMAVAYGHWLRHRNGREQVHAVDALALTVQRFGGTATREHIVTRHYSVALVRGATLGGASLAQAEAADTARDGDGIPSAGWPLNAPSTEELARAYGREPSPYLFAVSTLKSDFENYIIKPACQMFVLPDQERLQAERLAARSETIERLTRKLEIEASERVPDLRRDIQDLVRATISGTAARRSRASARARLRVTDTNIAQETDPFDRDGAADVLAPWEELQERLGPGAVETLQRLEQACWQARYADRPVRPDRDLVGRWIARRVLDLGWTTERFGDIDARLARGRSYGSEDQERFGKKYAWIAFHEVLGILSEHCTLSENGGDQTIAYRGPWQLNGVRDTDPSLALRGDEVPAARRFAPKGSSKPRVPAEPAWWLRPSQHSLNLAGDSDTWVADSTDVPNHLDLLRVRDPFGEEWLAVENHTTWEVNRREAGEEILWRQQWMRSQAYLIRQTDVQRVQKWASKQDWMGLWMPTASPHSPGFIGEYPDLEPWSHYLSVTAREAIGVRSTNEARHEHCWFTLDTHHIVCDMALATDLYTQHSGRDQSITRLSSVLLPSPPLLQLLDATWAPAETGLHERYQLGTAESEYSWQAHGQLVAFANTHDGPGAGSALWVRAEPLRASLAAHGLAMWVWTLGEKRPWANDQDPHPTSAGIAGACLLGPGTPRTWSQKTRLNIMP